MHRETHRGPGHDPCSAGVVTDKRPSHRPRQACSPPKSRCGQRAESGRGAEREGEEAQSRAKQSDSTFPARSRRPSLTLTPQRESRMPGGGAVKTATGNSGAPPNSPKRVYSSRVTPAATPTGIQGV